MPGSVFKRCGCRDALTGRMLGAVCDLLPLEGHGSWYLCIDLPPGSDGRRHRLRRSGFATRADAREDLDRFADPPPSPREDAGLLVGVWLNRWLASRLSIRPETHRSYGKFIRNCLEPYLGGMLVSQVRAEDVQRMFASIIRVYEEAGRPLTQATVQRIKRPATASVAGRLKRFATGWWLRRSGIRHLDRRSGTAVGRDCVDDSDQQHNRNTDSSHNRHDTVTPQQQPDHAAEYDHDDPRDNPWFDR